MKSKKWSHLPRQCDHSLVSRFVPFDELGLTRRLFVQEPLIVPTKGISLEILLSAISDCSRIGVRSAFTECLIRHHESPRGLVFAIAVAGCHVSLSLA